MGVSFSHGDASWSYRGVNAFRERLAREIGMDLRAMDGFGGQTPWPNSDDPIMSLLQHSDSDGILSSETCRHVAPRLRELVSDWDESFFARHDKIEAERLAQGMDLAAARDEMFEFC